MDWIDESKENFIKHLMRFRKIKANFDQISSKASLAKKLINQTDKKLVKLNDDLESLRHELVKKVIQMSKLKSEQTANQLLIRDEPIDMSKVREPKSVASQLEERIKAKTIEICDLIDVNQLLTEFESEIIEEFEDNVCFDIQLDQMFTQLEKQVTKLMGPVLI